MIGNLVPPAQEQSIIINFEHVDSGNPSSSHFSQGLNTPTVDIQMETSQAIPSQSCKLLNNENSMCESLLIQFPKFKNSYQQTVSQPILNIELSLISSPSPMTYNNELSKNVNQSKQIMKYHSNKYGYNWSMNKKKVLERSIFKKFKEASTQTVSLRKQRAWQQHLLEKTNKSIKLFNHYNQAPNQSVNILNQSAETSCSEVENCDTPSIHNENVTTQNSTTPNINQSIFVYPPELIQKVTSNFFSLLKKYKEENPQVQQSPEVNQESTSLLKNNQLYLQLYKKPEPNQHIIYTDATLTCPTTEEEGEGSKYEEYIISNDALKAAYESTANTQVLQNPEVNPELTRSSFLKNKQLYLQMHKKPVPNQQIIYTDATVPSPVTVEEGGNRYEENINQDSILTAAWEPTANSQVLQRPEDNPQLTKPSLQGNKEYFVEFYKKPLSNQKIIYKRNYGKCPVTAEGVGGENKCVENVIEDDKKFACESTANTQNLQRPEVNPELTSANFLKNKQLYLQLFKKPEPNQQIIFTDITITTPITVEEGGGENKYEEYIISNDTLKAACDSTANQQVLQWPEVNPQLTKPNLQRNKQLFVELYKPGSNQQVIYKNAILTNPVTKEKEEEGGGNRWVENINENVKKVPCKSYAKTRVLQRPEVNPHLKKPNILRKNQLYLQLYKKPLANQQITYKNDTVTNPVTVEERGNKYDEYIISDDTLKAVYEPTANTQVLQRPEVNTQALQRPEVNIQALQRPEVNTQALQRPEVNTQITKPNLPKNKQLYVQLYKKPPPNQKIIFKRNYVKCSFTKEGEEGGTKSIENISKDDTLKAPCESNVNTQALQKAEVNPELTKPSSPKNKQTLTQMYRQPDQQVMSKNTTVTSQVTKEKEEEGEGNRSVENVSEDVQEVACELTGNTQVLQRQEVDPESTIPSLQKNKQLYLKSYKKRVKNPQINYKNDTVTSSITEEGGRGNKCDENISKDDTLNAPCVSTVDTQVLQEVEVIPELTSTSSPKNVPLFVDLYEQPVSDPEIICENDTVPSPVTVEEGGNVCDENINQDNILKTAWESIDNTQVLQRPEVDPELTSTSSPKNVPLFVDLCEEDSNDEIISKHDTVTSPVTGEEEGERGGENKFEENISEDDTLKATYESIENTQILQEVEVNPELNPELSKPSLPENEQLFIDLYEEQVSDQQIICTSDTVPSPIIEKEEGENRCVENVTEDDKKSACESVANSTFIHSQEDNPELTSTSSPKNEQLFIDLYEQPVSNQQIICKNDTVTSPITEEEEDEEEEGNKCEENTNEDNTVKPACESTGETSIEETTNQVNTENVNFPNKYDLPVSEPVLDEPAAEEIPLENYSISQNYEELSSDSDSDDHLIIDEEDRGDEEDKEDRGDGEDKEDREDGNDKEDREDGDDKEDKKDNVGKEGEETVEEKLLEWNELPPDSIYEPMVLEIPKNIDMTKKIKELFAKTAYCPVIHNKFFSQNFDLWEEYKNLVAQNLYQPIIYREVVNQPPSDNETLHQLLIDQKNSEQPIICGKVNPNCLEFWDCYKELISDTVYQLESDKQMNLDNFYLWEKYKELIVKTVYEPLTYSQAKATADTSSDVQTEEQPIINKKRKNKRHIGDAVEQHGNNKKTDKQCAEKKLVHPIIDCKCYMCGKIFHEKKKLHQHVISKHTDIRLVTCKICMKKFVNPNLLSTHMVNNHLTTKHIICLVCLKATFTELQKFRLHIFQKHRITSVNPLYKYSFYKLTTRDIILEEKHRKKHNLSQIVDFHKEGTKNILFNVCGKDLRNKIVRKFRLFCQKKNLIRAAHIKMSESLKKNKTEDSENSVTPETEKPDENDKKIITIDNGIQPATTPLREFIRNFRYYIN